MKTEGQRSLNPQHGGHHQTLLSNYEGWKWKGYLNWKVVGCTITVIPLPHQWVHLAWHVNIVSHRPRLSWTVVTIPPAACIVPPGSKKANQQGGSAAAQSNLTSPCPTIKDGTLGQESFPSSSSCSSSSVKEAAGGSCFQVGPCPTPFQEQRGQPSEKYFIVIPFDISHLKQIAVCTVASQCCCSQKAPLKPEAAGLDELSVSEEESLRSRKHPQGQIPFHSSAECESWGPRQEHLRLRRSLRVNPL